MGNIITRITLIGIAVSFQTGFSQNVAETIKPDTEKTAIISGMHTLSIHVTDTMTHDSVYRFLVHQLGLPVYYTPEKYGEKMYAGIYAGNMVLEPCGPYPEIDYATEGFRSIFFGMNFKVNNSLTHGREMLDHLGVIYQANRNSIYIRDSFLCNENVFCALYEIRDKEKRDSLCKTLQSDRINKAGIEYVKVIGLGYRDEITFRKWKEFLHPLEFVDIQTCKVNDSLQIHFTQGRINEVKGITFKVESIEQAIRYFSESDLLEPDSDHGIVLDREKTFGLRISLTQAE